MVQILNYVYKTITTTLVSDIKLKKLSTKTVLNLCTVIWKLKKTVDVCVVTGLDIQQ
jgi:predicted alpha-1,6-mannanase (GH76 family)